MILRSEAVDKSRNRDQNNDHCSEPGRDCVEATLLVKHELAGNSNGLVLARGDWRLNRYIQLLGVHGFNLLL